MKRIKILLVEDDKLDVMDITRTLDKLNVHYDLMHVKNGVEALNALNLDEENAALPDFVLIDINMPKMNGLELLQKIRENERWKNLKCFVITTSDEKADHTMAEALNVSGYIIKPLKLNSPSTMDAFNLLIDLKNFNMDY